MRQECRVTVTLTYDCDASLSREQLIAAIMADLNRLADPDSGSPVEMNGGAIAELREERELYGNA
jgi:hypothetical protein